jgi:hypothetical protein
LIIMLDYCHPRLQLFGGTYNEVIKSFKACQVFFFLEASRILKFWHILLLVWFLVYLYYKIRLADFSLVHQTDIISEITEFCSTLIIRNQNFLRCMRLARNSMGVCLCFLTMRTGTVKITHIYLFYSSHLLMSHES